MARCLSCSYGEARPGTNQCPRCAPHRTQQRTPEQLAELHRTELERREARLAVVAARDPHYQPDLDRVRTQLANLNPTGVTT